MAIYVLVHGSFQGGWIWKTVGDALADAGHRVYRPTLEGSAERRLHLRASLRLPDLGAELADLLFFEDLWNVVLVGTSMGGMVVAEAAQRVPDRIKRIILIDALLPLPGESVPTINSRPPYDKAKVVYGNGADATFGDLPSEVQQWARERYTPQPVAPTDDPVDLREFWSRSWQVDVLCCTRSPLPPEAHQRRTAERLHGRYSELAAGHYPMLSHPRELTEYLLART
jgi:pimeloyl-ACP methyl ester carboxylesterase